MGSAKKSLRAVLLVCLCAAAGAQTARKSAADIKKAALQKDSVQEGVEYMLSQVDSCATAADKRSLLAFAGSVQEQLGLYAAAASSYARAAGIAAGDAAGMPPASSEQLVLAAVRSCLQCGDYENADAYLNSSVRASTDETVRAFINLYSAWSALCKAKSMEDTGDTLSLLKAYVDMASMKSVRPAVLLTLWYLTDEPQYGALLKEQYPASPECAVVQGNAQIMSVPFWYFVPRVAHADGESVAASGAPAPPPSAPPSAASQKDTSVTRQQLGLFRNEDNADALIARVKAKGFAAYRFSETRASGTTYYIVVVDDPDGTVAPKLRNAGFECYPIK